MPEDAGYSDERTLSRALFEWRQLKAAPRLAFYIVRRQCLDDQILAQCLQAIRHRDKDGSTYIGISGTGTAWRYRRFMDDNYIVVAEIREDRKPVYDYFLLASGTSDYHARVGHFIGTAFWTYYSDSVYPVPFMQVESLWMDALKCHLTTIPATRLFADYPWISPHDFMDTRLHLVRPRVRATCPQCFSELPAFPFVVSCECGTPRWELDMSSLETAARSWDEQFEDHLKTLSRCEKTRCEFSKMCDLWHIAVGKYPREHLVSLLAHSLYVESVLSYVLGNTDYMIWETASSLAKLLDARDLDALVDFARSNRLSPAKVNDLVRHFSMSVALSEDKVCWKLDEIAIPGPEVNPEATNYRDRT